MATDEARREADAAWRKAQEDIVRHDREFEKAQQKKGGKK